MTNNYLIKKEKELRELLTEANIKFRKNRDFNAIKSPEYSTAWSQWANLRDEGVSRKLFMFFVPRANDANYK